MSKLSHKNPFDAHQILNNELYSYNPGLLKKRQLVVANKMDLSGAEDRLRILRKKLKKKIIPISCKDGNGIEILVKEVAQVLWKDKD